MIALVIVFVAVFGFTYRTYPLVLTSQELMDTNTQLPYFRLCFNESSFLGEFVGAGLVIFDPINNETKDCYFGTIHHNESSNVGYRDLCPIIHWNNVHGFHCVYLTPDESYWSFKDKDKSLILLAVIETQELSSSPILGWPFARLLTFSWIPPEDFEIVFSQQENRTLIPECNELLLGVNGFSILNFDLQIFEHFHEVCYATTSSFIPYSKQDQDRICTFMSGIFIPDSVLNCSMISLNDSERFTFIHLRLSLSKSYVQYFTDEHVNHFVIRMLSTMGGMVSLVIPLLTALFGFFLTRLIFWKQRDAYYSDEIREAITYFLYKERQRLETDSTEYNNDNFSKE